MEVPSRLQQRLYISLISVFRTAVPKPEDRIPLSQETWPHLLSPVLPILIMAYLVRRPNTHLLRILLFPIVLFNSLQAGFCYVWLEPQYNVYNWGGALVALVIIAKALDYAFAVDGIKKVDETVPGQSVIPAIATGSTPSPSPPGSSLSKRPLGGVLPASLLDSMEIFFSMRGIGFDYGRDVSVPPDMRPFEKGPFLGTTLREFLINFLVLDLIDATLKLTPPLRTPMGGSIFMPSLPWLTRYMVSTALHFASGCGIIAGFQMIYSLLTLFGVTVLSHSPKAWPPLFDNPWAAQSLHSFWASRWHQVLRRTFMIYGGLPGKWMSECLGFGTALGMLFGTFIASGLFHELTCYAMGRGLDWHTPAFFLLQAFLILGERIWRGVTGRRVGGWQGSVWVCFVIIVLGQNMIDSWHRRGLGGGLIVPPVLSPTRRILFPALNCLIETLKT